MNPSLDTMSLEWRDGFAVLRFVRPEARNSITELMIKELHSVLDELESDPVPLLITGGDDGVFIGGADIGELLLRDEPAALRGINVRAFDRLSEYPMPTLAAIDGYALGGGAELTYACDMRFATPRAIFGQPEPRLGIIAGAGGCYRLSSIVGDSLARDVLFTGRRISGEEALEAGLISRLIEPTELLEEAGRAMKEIAKGSSQAIRMTKLALAAEPSGHPEIDIAIQAVLFESEEKRRRMTAFLDRNR